MGDNVIGRMRVACWISKAKDTHSEYVILNGFLLQQWLHERVSVLGYMYIASFVEVLIRPHQLYVDLLYTGAVSYTNAMDQSPWEFGSHSVKQFPAFYGTWRQLMVFTRTSHWDPVLSEKNLGQFIPPVFNSIRLNIIFTAYNFFSPSSSSLALRLVFRPWPPHLLPPTFAVPCCRLPILYLRQIYSILPSTSRLCHRSSSSLYFFGDTRATHPCYVSSHCSLFSIKMLKVPHHTVCRSPFCL